MNPRRKRLQEAFPDALVVVRGTAAEGLSPNFFYLTGLQEPSAVLVLSASGVRVGTGRDAPGPDYLSGRPAHQVLFLPSTNPVAERWGEGARSTLEGTSAEAAGVDAVLPLSEFESRLTGWLRETKSIACVRAAPPSLGGSDPDAAFVERIRARFFGIDLADATDAVGEMRTRKNDAELAAIEKAAAVTANGFDRALAALQPGRMEHEIEAELAGAYRTAGAEHAFGPIVGAGRNALKLHYRDNASPIGDGDLVLIDSGARLNGYCSDVTRTFPASGKFTSRQRELYDVVLSAQQAAIEAVRAGALLGDLHAAAWKRIDAAGHGDAFVHGIGHHLGIEVHDAGDVHRPLEAGAVITIEPGIYLEDEGVGIRIEDDVLVTADGCRVLTDAIPKSVDEIEHRVGGDE